MLDEAVPDYVECCLEQHLITFEHSQSNNPGAGKRQDQIIRYRKITDEKAVHS